MNSSEAATADRGTSTVEIIASRVRVGCELSAPAFYEFGPQSQRRLHSGREAHIRATPVIQECESERKRKFRVRGATTADNADERANATAHSRTPKYDLKQSRQKGFAFGCRSMHSSWHAAVQASMPCHFMGNAYCTNQGGRGADSVTLSS
ncbi:hypothetical protein FA95DRAFT_645459 [Auriscalpium vulgare]|uniref:Uncharacterized protein n=1 Tax=Auriscalpium vulgare TaxID=40419 RepID=A0ACB8S1U7_9AGAM|nr:hypothetical protein FA95DRAFT_645459 [Auriscalpium vulgare]